MTPISRRAVLRLLSVAAAAEDAVRRSTLRLGPDHPHALAAAVERAGVWYDLGRVADAEGIPYDDDTFDLVVGHAVLHHIPDVEQSLREVLRVLKPGGTLSSLGVYSTDLTLPLDAFGAGLGDNKIVTSLCPGGKERMRRLMNVIESGRVDLEPLVTHRYKLDDIVEAYDLFANQRDGVLKIAITP